MMKDEAAVFIPPVLLNSYEEFKTFAKQAALVVYTPEHFHSPFLDDAKRLRRVTLTALGVRVRGMALTFKYVLDYDSFSDASRTWDEQVAEVDDLMKGILASLETDCNLVRGTVEAESAIGETLMARP
jgi:hypothetical protein